MILIKGKELLKDTLRKRWQDGIFLCFGDEKMRLGGIHVILREEDAWDNLMRIKSVQVAAELLEIALDGKPEDESVTG
jgi:hypothetical protein